MHIKIKPKKCILSKDYVPTILAIGFFFNYGIVQFWCLVHPNLQTDIISARYQDALLMILSYFYGSMYKKTPDK